MPHYYAVNTSGIAKRKLTERPFFGCYIFSGIALVGCWLDNKKADYILLAIDPIVEGTVRQIATSMRIFGVFAISIYLLIWMFLRLRRGEKNPINWLREADIAGFIERGLRDTAIANRLPGSKGFLVPNIEVYALTKKSFVVRVETLSSSVNREEELSSQVAAALQGPYKNFIPVDFRVAANRRYVDYYCQDTSDNTFSPRSITDLAPQLPFEIRLASDLVWDIRKNPHGLIAGNSGSGKTTEEIGILAQVFAKYREGGTGGIWIADAKYELDFAFLPPEHLAFSPDEIVKMLDRLAIKTQERQKIATHYNHQAKTTGKTALDAGLDPIFIFIEEVGALQARLKKMDAKLSKSFQASLQEIIYTGRSAGVTLILLAQQPNATVIDTSIRDNTSLHIMFGPGSDELRRRVFGSDAAMVPTGGARFKGYVQLDGVTGRVPWPLRVIDTRSHGLNNIPFLEKAYHFNPDTLQIGATN